MLCRKLTAILSHPTDFKIFGFPAASWDNEFVTQLRNSINFICNCRKNISAGMFQFLMVWTSFKAAENVSIKAPFTRHLNWLKPFFFLIYHKDLWVYGIIESFMLGKTFKILESSCYPSTAKTITKLSQMPQPWVCFKHSQGWWAKTLPWSVCSNAWPPFH